MRTAIVTTTIFSIEPFLLSYKQNIQKFGHENNVKIFIAGDQKSPSDSLDVAAKYLHQGIQVEFLDLAWQKEYMKRFPDLAAVIPENSDNRRNVAYLVALEEGAQTIISVDDDNFPHPDYDFIGSHLCVGESVTLPEALGREGWYNLCSLLVPKYEDPHLYPRGFPYCRRKDGTDFTGGLSNGKIGINVGLWTINPDADAISRLYANPYITDWTNQELLLGKGVRCPINTQNTALSRQAMGAYYYVKMGDTLQGLKIDRFGDIFSGYFVQICAEAAGDRIRIGSPIAEHRRNDHNLFIDLYNELAGIMIVEDLVEFFEKVELPKSSYIEAYRKLSRKLEDYVLNATGFIWQAETKTYFQSISRYMRIWADVVTEVL